MSDIDPRSLREELEIRVVALLTGELPEADADELETILSVDEELSAFRDRMAGLIGDVHAARDEIAPPVAHQQMKLSDDRRREIFGDVAVHESFPKEETKKWWHLGVLEIAAMLIFGGFVAALSVPSFQKVRSSAQMDVLEFEMHEPEFEDFGFMPAERETAASPQTIPVTDDLPALGRLFKAEEAVVLSEKRMRFKSESDFSEQPQFSPPPPSEVLEARSSGISSGRYAGREMVEEVLPVDESAPVAMSWGSGGIESDELVVAELQDSVAWDFESTDTKANSSLGYSAGTPVNGAVRNANRGKSREYDSDAIVVAGQFSQVAKPAPPQASLGDVLDRSDRSEFGRSRDSYERPQQTAQPTVTSAPVSRSTELAASEWATIEQSETSVYYDNADMYALKKRQPSAVDAEKELSWGEKGDVGLNHYAAFGVNAPSDGYGDDPFASSVESKGRVEALEKSKSKRLSEVDDGWAGSTSTSTRMASEGGELAQAHYDYDVDAEQLGSAGIVDAFAAPSSSKSQSKKDLQRGRAQYLNGDYAGAAAFFEDVVAKDPNNAEAKLFIAKAKEMRDYQAGGGYQTRQQMLTQVDQSWERPKVFEVESKVSASPKYVPPTLEQRQQSIVIPQVNFSGIPLSKAIETLCELSLEYDSDRVGVPIDYTPFNGKDPRVNISLRNLNLEQVLQYITQQVDHEFAVVGDRIQVQPQVQLSAAEQMAEARLKNTSQTPKAEKQTAQAPVSTFSLNVSDVSFKLAQAALASQRIPSSELIRTEEFVNSFTYSDPAPRENEPVTLNWEIAQHPYQHNRQIVRFSLQTQAAGRNANQPLNLNLLVDNSGSMQRPDRRAILEKSLEALQSKLTDQDQLNVVLFSRQPKLIANASNMVDQKIAIEQTLNYQPEGGTNLESGLEVAYSVAQQNYDAAASNRVILMTDGAANLGEVDAANLAQTVIDNRKQGIALDAYGIGWEDYNDALLEEITRNGDGRYAFLNDADTAAEDFAEKLAGTLRVSAADVKVQILWNPERVKTYRQIGYDLHQLKEQDFRDNSVDAAEIGEAESGTALYVVQIEEDSEVVGGLGTLQVRYRVPATGEYVERAWQLEMPHNIPNLQDAEPSLRLAASSALFAERLANNPFASNYSFEDLEGLTRDLPAAFPTQPRVVELQNMIQSANSLFTRIE
ncbi:MAG: YfbK domain-containing protein [Opitutaceae bacterium]